MEKIDNLILLCLIVSRGRHQPKKVVASTDHFDAANGVTVAANGVTAATNGIRQWCHCGRSNEHSILEKLASSNSKCNQLVALWKKQVFY